MCHSILLLIGGFFTSDLTFGMFKGAMVWQLFTSAFWFGVYYFVLQKRNNSTFLSMHKLTFIVYGWSLLLWFLLTLDDRSYLSCGFNTLLEQKHKTVRQVKFTAGKMWYSCSHQMISIWKPSRSRPHLPSLEDFQHTPTEYLSVWFPKWILCLKRGWQDFRL